ncbi:MAG: carboxypeptidase-like regulatory domain-containing protein [Gemmatimonadaceae bacterium]|nr:carboxypeptidase-like regulatory domain-containing protein [Gemmatimonadaceae bacterium]
MNTLSCAVVAVSMIASFALGQDAPAGRRYEIRGVVFDSVAGVPLAGAMVQVAARGADDAPYTGFTDSLGRFSFSQLNAGVFIVGFYHENLSALGLDAPIVRVELGAASVVTVDLAIPSARVVRALRCGGDTVTNAEGMLVGFLRAAEGGLALPGATLRLSWRALALEASNYRTVTARATAVISSDGSFLACDLPVDAPLDLEVAAPGRRTLSGPVVSIPPNGVARLDLNLVDTARTVGRAGIRGHVSSLQGKSVSIGRARIAALGRDVPIRNGEFLLNGLPPGSWVIDSRAIGTEPEYALVSATDSTITVADLRVGASLQRLEAVTVVGNRDANTRLLEEVLRRKRIGMGTVFLPGSPALESAIFTSDVMKEARGFAYGGPNAIRGRARCKNIAVYVNDVLQPDGFNGVESIASPPDVLAIETFPDILFAPVKYRIMKEVLGVPGQLYCAVVLVWTKYQP